MPQQISPLTVAERAANRYYVARSALEGMQIDLAVLTNGARHSLRSQKKGYSDVVLSSVIRGESGDVEVLSAHVSTWLIPHTRYYLPDWQQGDNDRDLFAFPLGHAIIEMTAHGAAKAILFDKFAQQCNLSEYIGVCRGLDELANPTEATPAKTGDGMEN